MNVSSIKRLLLVFVMVFGFISLLTYYGHVSYSTERQTNVNRDTKEKTKEAQIYNNNQNDQRLIPGNDASKVVNTITDQIENKNNEIVKETPYKSNQTDQNNDPSKVINEKVPPLDDFEKYPCVPDAPFFPTSNWAATGKCVRMFNDTERANNLINKCVPLRTSKGTTPICIYDSIADHFISASLQKSGQWEGGLVDNILNMLNKHPNAEFLDLGCNIGTYSLAAAAFGHRIIAVDAVIDNLELLSKSLTLGGLQDKATLVWNAISDEYSKVALTKYKGNVGGTAIRNLTTEDKKNKETFITQTIKLDDIAPLMKGKTIVIKMDIETKEYSALLGGTNFFDSVDIPMIQMEINWHRTRESGPKIVQYLAQRNFAAFADPVKLRPLNVSKIQTWPGDVYFLKS